MMKRISKCQWPLHAAIILLGLTLAEAPLLAAPAALQPVVLIAGKSYGCQLDPGETHCEIPGIGRLSREPETLRLSFASDAAVVLNGLGWEGDVPLANAKAVLSHGFQSWSTSGVIAIPPPAGGRTLERALTTRDEEFRDGRAMSWELSFAASDDQFVFVGARTARRWKPWVQLGRKNADTLHVRIMSGGAGEALPLAPGESRSGEEWVWRTGPLAKLPEVLQRHGASLPGRGARPLAGWNSWYHLWDGVDQQAFLANLDGSRSYLTRLFERSHVPIPKLAAVLDDGWELRWGDWQPNRKFSEGLAPLARKVSEQGLIPGLWLAPFLVSVHSPLVTEKPTWFVETANYEHPSGSYKILDTTHPEVQEHLRELFRGVVAQGFRYLKLDFLFAGTFEGRRYRSVTGMEAYEIGLRLIREVVGEEVILLACGAPALASFPYVNAWRVGPDIAYQLPTGKPTWVDVALQLRNVSARWFLCQSVSCDTDPLLLRGKRPAAHVQSALWVLAFGAGGFFVSDDFRTLPAARREIPLAPLALRQALGGRPARPEPLVGKGLPDRLAQGTILKRVFDTSDVRAPLRWRLPSGEVVLVNTEERDRRVEGVVLRKRGSRVLSGQGAVTPSED